jgi:hypothetical protein
LDPNDGAQWGRFLKNEVHDAIHANYKNAGKRSWGDGSGGGGPWNYQWWMFFDENPGASADDIIEFLNDLVVATSDDSIRRVEDVVWPHAHP